MRFSIAWPGAQALRLDRQLKIQKPRIKCARDSGWLMCHQISRVSGLTIFLKTAYNFLFSFVLHSFKRINRRIRSKLPVWRIEEETLEHVNSSVKVFKWIILPSSFLYMFVVFCLFRENALDSMLWGLLVFFYSNFLPDLPSIQGKKEKQEK